MKVPDSHAPSSIVVIMVACCLTIVLTAALIHVSAQTDCVTPLTSPNGSLGAWPQNARITVVINSSQFSQSQFNCLQTAFNNWNASSGNNGNQSGVRFNVTYSNTPVVTGTTTSS